MATESPFPDVDIPEIDLWDFLFEQEKTFPDDRGLCNDLQKSGRKS
jgi:4-coumarate--CoA ligase